ncbi:MAG: HAMP domain-containing protein [Gammaproteobacteria bacterium]|nr:HAMP domain-containing protein [Gammaproteobacteria bacterium]
MSYKQKLVFYFVFFISLVEGISLSFDVYHSYQIRLNFLKERTELISSTYAQSLSIPIWNLDQETIQNITSSMLKDPYIVSIEIQYINNILPKVLLTQSPTIKKQILKAPNHYNSYKFPIYEPESTNIIAEIILDNDLTSSFEFLKNRSSLALLEFFILIIINILIVTLLMKWMTTPLISLNKVIQKLATNDIEVKIPYLNRDDEIGDVARSIEIFKNNKKELTILQKSMEDKITEQTQSLRDAKEKAEAGLLSKTQFLSTMSHEIRTPLNGIMGMADLLKLSDLSKDDQEYLDIILQSGKNLTYIIAEILDFSTIDSTTLEAIPFNLLELTENIINEFNQKAQQKSLELKISYESDNRYFIGDPIRIKQILVNIIDNSIKFTHQGHVIVSVKSPNQVQHIASNLDHKCSVIITIEDSGIGIAQQDQERVFDAFTQLDQSNTREYGGTGLGLSISKKMVDLMQGHITLDSLLEKGTCINIYLPLATQEKNAINNE